LPGEKVQSDFDQIGIDIDSSQMMILKAVMAASGGPAKFVTYKEIAEKLQELEKKKKPYTKAYIYRHLSTLEREGYVVVDAVQKPRRYAISESGILGSLEKKKKVALSGLQTKRKDVSARMDLLKSINPESVTFLAFNQLMGLESVEGSIIIEGVENVRNTIIREFGTASEAGDKIRVIAPTRALDRPMEQSGMAEMSLMVKASEGVKIIGLIIPDSEQSVATELVVKYIQNIREAFANLTAPGNILLRIAKENIKTYRMTSLNREKMLLYLTHAAKSDMAALIHRKDNPGLIDDAVDTFDRIFDEGIDVMDIVKQSLSEDQ